MERRMGTLIVLVLLAVTDAKPTRAPCGGSPSDVVFVLDASTSIWEPNFTKQLKFVQKLISAFDIGPNDDQTRVGVITFSDTSSVELALGDYSDTESLQKAVMSIPYQTGATNTSEALKTARTKMFTVGSKPREEAVKIAVVITDGQSQDTVSTDREAMALKASGVQVFAIGVGSDIDQVELKTIASSPSDDFMFTVDDYSALDSIQERLATKTCDVTRMTTAASTVSSRVTTPAKPAGSSEPLRRPTQSSGPSEPSTATPVTLPQSSGSSEPSTNTPVTPTPTIDMGPGSSDVPSAQSTPSGVLGDQPSEPIITKVCQGKPAEVFFLLDSSSSILEEDFEKQAKFVQRVINLFDVGELKTRVGLSTFSDDVTPLLDLGSFLTKPELLSALHRIPYLGGGTNTGSALRDMSERGMAPETIRQEVAHVAIVLTDGQSRDPVVTVEQAFAAKSRGIYIFAIGIGDDVDKQELDDIASQPSERFVFHVSNYDALESIKDILAIRTCEVDPVAETNDQKACPEEATDVTFIYDSGRLGSQTSKRVSLIVSNVIGRLPMSETGFQFGVLADTCSQGVDLRLTANRLSMTSSLMQRDRRDLSDLFRDLRTTTLRPENGARRNARKVAVVFLDGSMENFEETIAQVRRSKSLGVEIYVVALSQAVEKSEVTDIASEPLPRHILYLRSDDNLLQQTQSLEDFICEHTITLESVPAS